MPNRLAQATSPYLQQHADNPVDWVEWGPEAFARWATVALNLVALGAGSIVSATHKDENSVSADFSTTTDVVIAVALLGPAVIAAWLTWRSWPRQGVLTG